MLPLHQPCIRVVLRQSELLTFHHLKIHIRFKQHPHKGGMGQYFHHPASDSCIIASFQYLRAKTGTIHAVNPDNPLLNFLPAVHGAVYRKVAPLGMSAYIEGSFDSGSHGIQIFYTVLLTGNRRQKCHVEIFLPAHNRFIRSPISQINRTVLQQEGNGGKLGFPFLLHQIDITVQLQIPVSFSGKHGIHQCPVDLLIAYIRKQFVKFRVLF